jgi:hypothetical protein
MLVSRDVAICILDTDPEHPLRPLDDGTGWDTEGRRGTDVNAISVDSERHLQAAQLRQVSERLHFGFRSPPVAIPTLTSHTHKSQCKMGWY